MFIQATNTRLKDGLDGLHFHRFPVASQAGVTVARVGNVVYGCPIPFEGILYTSHNWAANQGHVLENVGSPQKTLAFRTAIEVFGLGQPEASPLDAILETLRAAEKAGLCVVDSEKLEKLKTGAQSLEESA